MTNLSLDQLGSAADDRIQEPGSGAGPAHVQDEDGGVELKV